MGSRGGRPESGSPPLPAGVGFGIVPTAIGLGCLAVLVWGNVGDPPLAASVVAAAGSLVLLVHASLTFRSVRSARTLERVRQVLGVGYWEGGPGVEVQTWSPVMFDILGLDPERVQPTAAAFAATVHPDDAAALARAFEQGAAGGTVDLVHRLVRSDGEVRVVHTRAQIDRAADGRTDRWLGTVQDITDRERLAAALEHSEDMLRRVLAATNDGWWTEDLRTGEAFHSPRWWELHGYEPGDLPDDPELSRRLTHPDDVERMEQEFADAVSAGTASFTTETRVLHREGHVVPILVRVLIEYDERGRAVRFSAATTDLTEARQAERAKDAFISTVSHELRTPLTAIGGSLETLRAGVAGSFPPPAQQLIELAQRNTARLRVLVDDLLDLEQLLAGATRFELTEGPLLPVIERTLEDNTLIAMRHEVRFELVATDADPWARFEPSRVAQVLTNYLSNAARFAPAGSAVQVRVQQVGDLVRTEVVDRGPGVPATFAPRVFERFAQADSTDRRRQGGTGLGLAISKEIVERLGGTVGFASEPGSTSFYFDLPAADAPADG